MKPKTTDSASAAVPSADPAAPVLPAPPVVDERIERIEALWQRSSGYVQFICAAGSLSGTSSELKEKALDALCERLVVVERQLSRIQDDLRLG